MNRIIREIIWWWQRRHNALTRLPEWRRADETERRGHRKGCTQDIGRARRAKYKAVHAALRSHVKGA